MNDERVKEIRWQKLRRGEVADAAAAGAILLLPIGAIEQHGPHLPLDTDADAATAVAEGAAARLDDPPALVLPPIWWGLSPYWMPFAGTLTLRAETILALIDDIGASVAAHGFRKLVIVNGHGGNGGLIGVAATRLVAAGLHAVALSYWQLISAELASWSPGDAGNIGHAGETETSIALYRQPDRVAQPLPSADAGADMALRAEAPFAGVGYASPDPLREAPNGIYGQASAGRRELGEQVIELATERLAAFVRHFAREEQ